MLGTLIFNFPKGDTSTRFFSTEEVTVYMVRNTRWTAVDTAGWTPRPDLDQTGVNPEFWSLGSVVVYERTFAAGSHWLDTHTASYAFANAINGDLHE